MSIFNFKKDINQIKETGRKIEEKTPPIAISIRKSIFAILKWIIIVGMIFLILLVTYNTIYYFVVEVPEERAREARQKEEARKEEVREEKYQDCLNECDNKYPSEGLILPGSGYIPISERNIPSIKRTLCLADCEEKYTK